MPLNRSMLTPSPAMDGSEVLPCARGPTPRDAVWLGDGQVVADCAGAVEGDVVDRQFHRLAPVIWPAVSLSRLPLPDPVR